MSKRAILIFPHQIFESCALLKEVGPQEVRVYLIEEFLFFRQFNFHKQKLVLHRASMKSYQDYLISKGYDVKYIESSKMTTNKSLHAFLTEAKFSDVFYTDTVDDWLERKIAKACKVNKTKLTMFESPMFLTNREELNKYKATTKRPYFMKNFYIWQRKRLGALVDKEGEPFEGRWSFDIENRKKIPKEINIPVRKTVKQNKYVKEAVAYVANNFSDHVGSVDNFTYATTFKESRACLKEFLEERLGSFGPYEDAIDHRSHTLFHSVLSPYLNTGLLQPFELLDVTLTYSLANSNISIESLEGFIRQIIGWREYMRLVYIDMGGKIRKGNYFNAQSNLPKSFWNGDTHIDPIDHTVAIIKDNAYCHHIPRLMVLGNFMNLCGFRPADVYKWFMEMFIDSYDWVMVPNVYSMALYADGGLITTKPYISSSNYICKMSDYKKTTGWNIKWDALYWSFIHRHHRKLDKENRLGFVSVQYKKMDKKKISNYLKIAENTIKDLLHD